jgi:hypothetical protein
MRFAMSLPPAPSVAEARIGRLVAGALMLLLLALLHAAPARADAQPDPYTATVKVDATAANAVDARRMARLNGQRQALAEVVEGLSGAPDVQLPKLDDNAISNMVDNFEVANEHMSTVRYLADYTFHFHPAKVRQLMQDAGVAAAGGAAGNGQPGNTPAEGAAESRSAGELAVVLPVFQDGGTAVLWDDPNPWRDAWTQRAPGSGAVQLTVPLGGVGDATAIDAVQAVSGEPNALTAITDRNGGGDAIVALATAAGQHEKLAELAVTVKRYHQGRLAGSQTVNFSINPGENQGDFMRRAVDSTAAAIEDGANGGAGESGPTANLTATVPLTGLGDWIDVRTRLASVPSVRRVDLLSLSRQEARIQITYAGTPDDLKSSLAGSNLDLGGSDPIWQVKPASAASPP